MAGLIYNFLLLLTLPIVLPWYLWRIFVERKANKSWRDNLGGLPRMGDPADGERLLWIHAASVGEVVASLPVQTEIKRLAPATRILLTTITQTGHAYALEHAGLADEVAFFPLDYIPFVNRALNRVRPDGFVMMESEIWPNFLAAARRRGIPTALISGKVSDRTFKRDLRFRWLMSWALSNIDHYCMQTETHADRIRRIAGSKLAQRLNVTVTGSTKFDQECGTSSPDKINSLRKEIGLPDGVRAIVAGSTNPGEDEVVLDAFKKTRNGNGALRLIIAPRKMSEVDAIEEMAQVRGFKCARRSLNGKSDYDVLILDTFGELANAYAFGDLAFVGGTLVPKGGHSIVQPIIHGKPVLFGPHTFKTQNIADMAISAGVGFQVADSDELASRMALLLADDQGRLKISEACARLISENCGASARGAKIIMEMMR